MLLLWFRLLDHLRLEWSANPQYTYGFAVPFLCLYLLWRDLRAPLTVPCQPSTTASDPPSILHPRRFLLRLPLPALLPLAAFLYLPTRLIQEANPDWRLVSWALALETITLTLLLAQYSLPGGLAASSPREPAASTPAVLSSSSPVVSFLLSSVIRPLSSVVRPLSSVFPRFPLAASRYALCFFLVSVPWPTIIEAPVIRALTHANTAATVELVSIFGIPAIQHGNIIEVGAGSVGIDDACSGIRSFQATLMLSLFFGLVYRLSVLRLSLLCLMGFLLSFLFNLWRTTLLTTMAAQHGTDSIARWHDPVGMTILLACFASLWAFARAQKSDVIRQEAETAIPKLPTFNRQLLLSRCPPSLDFPLIHQSINPSILRPLSSVLRPLSSVVCSRLLLWLVLSEAATFLWYRGHERNLPPPVAWTVELPRQNPAFREVMLSDTAKNFLRYDEAQNGAWHDDDGTRWQAIFLGWKPGRIAPHLARTHTPESCVTAAGRLLLAQSDLGLVQVGGGNWTTDEHRLTQMSEDAEQTVEGGGPKLSTNHPRLPSVPGLPINPPIHQSINPPPSALPSSDSGVSTSLVVSSHVVLLAPPSGLALPFRSYLFTGPDGPLHVFYCLWEDRAPGESFTASILNFQTRLLSVLAGRRNCGQRSLELAVWGIADPQEAEAAFRRLLPHLVKAELLPEDVIVSKP